MHLCSHPIALIVLIPKWTSLGAEVTLPRTVNAPRLEDEATGL